MIIGGNVFNYEGSTKAPISDLNIMALLLNSVLNTPGDKFMTTSIIFIYLKKDLK